MAVKTSAVKKTAIIPEQVAEAQKKIHDQYKTKMETTQKEYDDAIKADEKRSTSGVPQFVADAGRQNSHDDLKTKADQAKADYEKMFGKEGLKKPKSNSILSQGTVGAHPIFGKNPDGTYTFDTRPKKLIEEGNKLANEIKTETAKVGQEAKTDPTLFQTNDDLIKKQFAAKYGWSPEETEEYFKARSNLGAEGSKEKMEELVGKSKKKQAEPYIKHYADALHEQHPEWSHLQCVAEAQRAYEGNPKFVDAVKEDMQKKGIELPKETSYDENTREGKIARFSEEYPDLSLEEAARIIDEVWYKKDDPKKVDMSKFGPYGENSPLAQNAEDEKKKEKRARMMAQISVFNQKLKGWYQRNRGKAIGVTMNILGSAIRGGFNIANTILNTTQKMFNAFTSPHPMSAASQAYVSAVSGASELYEVFKDMNTAFGVNDPENQYSKNLLIGTIKGAMLDKEREKAQGIAVDWIRQFNDEIDALGVADPTQLTNEQSSKILNNMRNRMGQRLMDLKQKDTMNKWNMEHNGKPDAMTYSEKAELRILSSFDSQIGGELQLLNKIERAERPQNIQKRIELEKQNGVFVNVPETIDYNNIDLASSAFQTNDAYINNTILPRLRAFPTDTALSAEQKIERDALRSIVKDHNADKLRVDNIMNNLNQTIGFQINSATFNGLNGISSVDQLTEDNVRTAQINFENTYGAKLKRYNTTKTQSIAEDIEHRLLSNMEESLRKRGKDIENASNYQEKEKLNNKYQKMLSDNNISPIKVANNYIHILKPGQDPSSLYEMTYMSVKNDINTSDINGIKIDNPLYFEGSDGKRYPRPQTNEMNSYVSTLGDMVKSLEDPIQRDYIKMTNGCTDADLDYTLSELKKYKTESEVFRIENFIDGKNENDYTLFPHERYGYIPSDLKELMAGTWATDDVTVHKMIDKTDRAINYLENKNDPSLALQLRALKNLNHNLQILAWRRRYASSLSNYGISPDERKKELEEFDNIMNPFLLNYERDTMAPNSYDTKDPIHMTKFYTNFNKAGAKLTNKELEIYEKSPARKRNIGIFNLKTKDKMDEFLNIIKTEMKNAQINGAAQMEYFINKMKPILLGKPSWNFTDQTYDVEKARTAPKFENNKNITIKALGIDLKGRTKEYIENIDALSYYLATAYNDFFGTNILNGDQKIIDQRNFNKRFIDMFAEITGTIDEKARERSIKTYLRYAQNGGGNGLLHDQLQELANEDADLQRYVNGMYATHTGVSAKPIFDDKDKFISEFTRGFDPKKAKPEEKIAMQKAIATINQFFENKNQIVKNTKQMKKLLSLNADRIHNAISSTGYGLYQDTVSNYFNGVIQQHTAKNSKKTKDYIKKLAGQGLYLALNYVYTKDASKLSKSDIKMLKDLKKVIVLLDEKTVSEMIGVSSATNSQMLAYIYNNMGEIIDAIDKL